MLQTLHAQTNGLSAIDENLIYNIKMYMWCIDVHRRGTITHENKYRKRTIGLYCMFSALYIKSPFDNKIFTADNGGIYSTKFRVYEYKIADLITSLMSNRVVGGHLDFVKGIDHIIDARDIYSYLQGDEYDETIECLRRINYLMANILLTQ